MSAMSDEMMGVDVEQEPVADSRYRLYSAGELADLPEPEDLVHRMLYQRGLAGFVGGYESFKTFVLLSIAYAIAELGEWYGRPCTQGAVVVIYAEGAWGARRRTRALMAYHRREDWPAGLYFVPTTCDITSPREVTKLIKEIRQKLPAHQPLRLVVVDTYAANSTGPEDKEETANAFLGGCRMIRDAFGCAVAYAHHFGWNAERSRGSSALPAGIDTEVSITRDGDRVTLKCTKQKEAEHFPEMTFEAIKCLDSMVLVPFVPTSQKLSQNELKSLLEVQDSDGLRHGAWRDATGLSVGSFANALRRLKALGYVEQKSSKYNITDAGRNAVGTTGTSQYNAEYNEPHQLSTNPSPPFKGGSCTEVSVLDDGLEPWERTP